MSQVKNELQHVASSTTIFLKQEEILLFFYCSVLPTAVGFHRQDTATMMGDVGVSRKIGKIFTCF